VKWLWRAWGNELFLWLRERDVGDRVGMDGYEFEHGNVMDCILHT
jgi:hypothetical protein